MVSPFVGGRIPGRVDLLSPYRFSHAAATRGLGRQIHQMKVDRWARLREAGWSGGGPRFRGGMAARRAALERYWAGDRHGTAGWGLPWSIQPWASDDHQHQVFIKGKKMLPFRTSGPLPPSTDGWGGYGIPIRLWAAQDHYHKVLTDPRRSPFRTSPPLDPHAGWGGYGAAELPGGTAATIEKVLVTAGAYLLAMGVWEAVKRRR
jgi:hypothetical protein